VEKESGRVDMDTVAEPRAGKTEADHLRGQRVQPRLGLCRFRAIADEVGAVLMADVSHPAGLIAAKLLNDPLPHCHVVTTTTHKTLRGPRGGLIMMGKDFENPGA
jgi:glycine hydroxymethyltransferase